jgi:hypothetical protein
MGTNKGAMERYVYVADSDGDFFLSLDDDIFLTPEQLTTLFQKLTTNASVPHGMFGQRWLQEDIKEPMKSFQNCIVETDGPVDILNRVYFFTKNQAKECLRLAHAANRNDTTLLSSVDDLFLAFSGRGKPQCHNVGRFIDCPTQAEPGIAQWTKQDFWHSRIELYQTLCKLTKDSRTS